MATLIEDLRTVSLAEAGALPLYREPTDLAILFAEVARSFALRAEASGVRVVPHVAGDLPLVDVDPVRIREVVGNLVDNAIRYAGREGVVSIDASLGAGWIDVAVTDTGPGIPPDL